MAAKSRPCDGWFTEKVSSQERGEILGRYTLGLLNLSVAEREFRGSEASGFLPSNFFISSAFLTFLSPGLTRLPTQLADRSLSSRVTLWVTRSRQSPCQLEQGLCVARRWLAGHPVLPSPGPLTSTPLKLEPSFYPRRLNWIQLWAGRREPRIPPCLTLDPLGTMGLSPVPL